MTLSFTSPRDLKTLPVVTISTHTVSVTPTSLTAHTYSASWTETVSDTEGAVPFAVDFTDVAGNVGTQVTSTTDASHVTLDHTAPTAPSTPASSTGATWINAAQRTAGFTITVSGLGSTGAVTNDTLTLLLGGSTLLTHTLAGPEIPEVTRSR